MVYSLKFSFLLFVDGELKNKEPAPFGGLVFIMTNGNVLREKIREVMQSYEDDLRRKKQFVHKEALIRGYWGISH